MTPTVALKATRTSTEQIPLNSLLIDHTYQRPLNAGKVREYAEKFDPDALGVLTVSKREGGACYVIDGQHRREAAITVGWGDRKVKCEVFTGLSIADEANIFRIRNRKVAMVPINRFRADLVAGDRRAIDITKACNRVGFVIEDSKGDGKIRCVTSLEAIYEGSGLTSKDGWPFLKELDWTLQTITTAWGLTEHGAQGDIVRGLGLLYLRHGGVVDKARMADKLAGVPSGPTGVLGRSRGLRDYHGGSLASCVAHFVTDLYNKGLRTSKLPEWRS